MAQPMLSKAYQIKYIKTHNYGDSVNNRLYDTYCHLYVTDSTSYNVLLVDKTKDMPSSPNGKIMMPPDSSEIVFKNTRENYLVFQSTIAPFAKGFFTDTLNLMRWAITSETKQVDSFTCTKATTHFRGRDYVAWFCPDIPLPHGPSKFGGLPGLIVELFDTNKINHYRMQDITVYSGQLPSYHNRYPDFADYKKRANKGFEMLKEKFGAQKHQTADCLGCGTNGSTSITITNWENIFDK
jgi:GLPGLI family protein